jgi:hypothetical protein
MPKELFFRRIRDAIEAERVRWKSQNEFARNLGLTGAPSAAAILALDALEARLNPAGTLLMNDQPVTCPACGSRTDWVDLPDGSQLHTCLRLNHRFFVAPE